MKKPLLILVAIALVVIVAAYVGSRYYYTSVEKVRIPANDANAGATPAAPLVRPENWKLGPADAKITLVEFFDPECESCAEFHPILKKILKDYEGKIRLVSRYMPLHPNSMTAATFLEVAGEQGKYWQAQEMLFEKQAEWGTKHGAPPDATEPSINQIFDKYAKELGIDVNAARQAVNERRFDAKIQQDKKDGQDLGARRTPTFFVNGRMSARFGEAPLRALIDEELQK
ncbi:MAG: thioredoxin domain-containing protein [Chloracidobacterium sp.]|nr:thioredoxin domain-containing protein [Chloracidobacterium sp.]